MNEYEYINKERILYAIDDLIGDEIGSSHRCVEFPDLSFSQLESKARNEYKKLLLEYAKSIK